MKQPVIVNYDPMLVLSLPAGATAFDTGDLCTLTSNALVLLAAASDDDSFVGVVGGKRKATGDMIPVYTRCIVSIDCTSATYALGAGIKYTSQNTVVADGNADTIGWVYGDYTSAVTRILVYFDVARLGAAANKLFDVASATSA